MVLSLHRIRKGNLFRGVCRNSISVVFKLFGIENHRLAFDNEEDR